MSLKAFHLVFVTALSSLAFGCSAWKFKAYADAHLNSDLLWAIAGLLGGIAVLAYGKYFLKKLKHLSFL
ncbi:MAG: hypothetical protein H7Y43_07260 [Akkermansiaceae bacterium]|nr:hypothetical protein [Verrucomicrobiales bacterium]